MWQLSYRPEVEDDVFDAVTWYDGKRLGSEILDTGMNPQAVISFLEPAITIHMSPTWPKAEMTMLDSIERTSR